MLERNQKIFTKANYEQEKHQSMAYGHQMHGKWEACYKIQSLSVGVLGMLTRKFFEIQSLLIGFGISFG